MTRYAIRPYVKCDPPAWMHQYLVRYSRRLVILPPRIDTIEIILVGLEPLTFRIDFVSKESVIMSTNLDLPVASDNLLPGDEDIITMSLDLRIARIVDEVMDYA